MLNDIATPQVQADLSKQIGRPAVVRTIAWGGPGYDVLFLIAQDLLEHRKVRQLVFYDEDDDQGPKNRNGVIPGLFRFGDNGSSMDGLPFNEKGLYYFASLFGMPLNFLSLTRPNIPAELLPNRPGYVDPPIKTITTDAPNQLGSVAFRSGFNATPWLSRDCAPFIPYLPSGTGHPQAAICNASKPDKTFVFSNAIIPSYQAHFARLFSELAESYGCKLVMLDLPALDSVRAPFIQERTYWPAVFSTNLTLVGIPNNQIFGGLADDDILKLFSERFHLNQNGQDYFTRLITPALLKIYETSTNN